jgi:hypothetical protein
VIVLRHVFRPDNTVQILEAGAASRLLAVSVLT